MPLRIYPNQQVLLVRESTGLSIALHGLGAAVKGLLIVQPILNDWLPTHALPIIPGPYVKGR